MQRGDMAGLGDGLVASGATAGTVVAEEDPPMPRTLDRRNDETPGAAAIEGGLDQAEERARQQQRAAERSISVPSGPS